MSASDRLLKAAAGNAGVGAKWVSIAPSSADITDEFLQLTAITNDSDGNIYVAGYTGQYVDSRAGGAGLEEVNGPRAAQNSPFIAKLDADGNISWRKVYRAPTTEATGNIYGVGEYQGIAVNNNDRIMVTISNVNSSRPCVMLVDATDGSFLDCMEIDISGTTNDPDLEQIATDGTDFAVVGLIQDNTDSIDRGIQLRFAVGSSTTIPAPGTEVGIKDASTATVDVVFRSIAWDANNSEYSLLGGAGTTYEIVTARIATSGSSTDRRKFVSTFLASNTGLNHIINGSDYYLYAQGVVVKLAYNATISTMYTATPTWAKNLNDVYSPATNVAKNVPHGMAISTDGNYLYVAVPSWGVVKLNTSDGSVAASLTFASLNEYNRTGSKTLVVANDRLYIVHNDFTGSGLFSASVIVIPEAEFDTFDFRLSNGQAILAPDSGYEASVSNFTYTTTDSGAASGQFYSWATVQPTDVTDYDSSHTITEQSNVPNGFIIQGVGSVSRSGTTGTYSFTVNNYAGGIKPKADDILIYFSAIGCDSTTSTTAARTTTAGFTDVTGTTGVENGRAATAIGYQDLTGTLSGSYSLDFSGTSTTESYVAMGLIVRGVSVATNFSVTQNNTTSNTLFITPNSVTAPNKGFIMTLIGAGGVITNNDDGYVTDPNATPGQFSQIYQVDTYDVTAALGIDYVDSASTVTLPEYQRPRGDITTNTGAVAVSIFLDTE